MRLSKVSDKDGRGILMKTLQSPKEDALGRIGGV